MAIYEEIPPPSLGGWRNAPQVGKDQALVIEGPDGYHQLKRYETLSRDVLRSRDRRFYRVDLTPREARMDERLPSNRQGRQFRATIRIVIGVANAASVVKHRVEDPWAALEPVLMPRIRQLTRKHGLGDLSEVEDALRDHLVGDTRADAGGLGLEITRASVSLDIDEDELQRERDRLQDEHYQQMEELRTRHRAKLDTLREEQRRELDAARARHERDLEEIREAYQRDLHATRQALYRSVIGGALPDLLLARLTSRPGGIEPGDIDEVIRLMYEDRWGEFAKPLELLSQHEGIITDQQREKLIETLLDGLVENFAARGASKERVDVQVNHPADPPAVAEPPRELEAPDDNPKG
jgi:vacuolar-type H+-ATPase subunit E/Vma4